MATVTFAKFSPEESKFVSRIVDRAVGPVYDERMTARMDIAATHAIMPLRLEELADADNFNFFHDMGGIARHLNRKTGEMEDCFVPRFTQ